MVFRTINDALEYYKLGKLEGMNDTIHASGITDKGIRVWLPVIPDNELHSNFIVDNGEYIWEIFKNDQHIIAPFMETSYVIKRVEVNSEKGKYDYEYIGQYKRVLFYNNFSVHLRVTVENPSGIFWDKSFIKSPAKAQKKAKKLYEEAKKLQKEEEQRQKK